MVVNPEVIYLSEKSASRRRDYYAPRRFAFQIMSQAAQHWGRAVWSTLPPTPDAPWAGAPKEAWRRVRWRFYRARGCKGPHRLKPIRRRGPCPYNQWLVWFLRGGPSGPPRR